MNIWKSDPQLQNSTHKIQHNNACNKAYAQGYAIGHDSSTANTSGYHDIQEAGLVDNHTANLVLNVNHENESQSYNKEWYLDKWYKEWSNDQDYDNDNNYLNNNEW